MSESAIDEMDRAYNEQKSNASAQASGVMKPPPGIYGAGMSDEEIVKDLGGNWDLVKSSPEYQRTARIYGRGFTQADKPYEIGSFIRGITDAVTEPVNMLSELAYKVMPEGDKDKAYGDMLRDFDRKRRSGESKGWSIAGNIAGSTMTLGALKGASLAGRMVRPDAVSLLGKTAQYVVKPAIKGAKTGAYYNMSMPPGYDPNTDYMSQKMGQGKTGAAVGATAGVVLPLVASRLDGTRLQAAAGRVRDATKRRVGNAASKEAERIGIDFKSLLSRPKVVEPPPKAIMEPSRLLPTRTSAGGIDKIIEPAQAHTRTVRTVYNAPSAFGDEGMAPIVRHINTGPAPPMRVAEAAGVSGRLHSPAPASWSKGAPATYNQSLAATRKTMQEIMSRPVQQEASLYYLNNPEAAKNTGLLYKLIDLNRATQKSGGLSNVVLSKPSLQLNRLSMGRPADPRYINSPYYDAVGGMGK